MIVLTDKSHNVVVRHVPEPDALALLTDLHGDIRLARWSVKNMVQYRLPMPIKDPRVVFRHYPHLEVQPQLFFLDVIADER